MDEVVEETNVEVGEVAEEGGKSLTSLQSSLENGGLPSFVTIVTSLATSCGIVVHLLQKIVITQMQQKCWKLKLVSITMSGAMAMVS